MALTVNTNIINDTDQYLLDAKNVKGSYVVVGSTTERDSLPAATTITGSLCYCTGDSKFYQYNGTSWVEKTFGTTTEATASGAGLMSASDKRALDNLTQLKIENGTGDNSIQSTPRTDKVTQAEGEENLHFSSASPAVAGLGTRIPYGATGHHATTLNGRSAAMAKHATSIGNSTVAKGEESFSQGYGSVAAGGASFAGGSQTYANGDAAVSVGTRTQALEENTFAGGMDTIAAHPYQTVFGVANGSTDEDGNVIVDKESLFEVGNGTYDAEGNLIARSTAFKVMRDGRAKVKNVWAEDDDDIIAKGFFDNTFNALNDQLDEAFAAVNEEFTNTNKRVDSLNTTVSTLNTQQQNFSNTITTLTNQQQTISTQVSSNTTNMANLEKTIASANNAITEVNDKVSENTLAIQAGSEAFTKRDNELAADIGGIQTQITALEQDLFGIETVHGALKRSDAIAKGENSVALAQGITTKSAARAASFGATAATDKYAFTAGEHNIAANWAAAVFGGGNKSSRPYQLVGGYANAENADSLFEIGCGEVSYQLLDTANKPSYDEAISSLEHYCVHPDGGYTRITENMDIATYANTDVYIRNKVGKNAFAVLADGRAKVYKAPEEADDVVRKGDLSLATASDDGLMSKTDKSNLDTIVNSFNSDDADATINTVKEVLKAFENAKEGTDIANALASKSEIGHNHETTTTAVLTGVKASGTDTFVKTINGGSGSLTSGDTGAIQYLEDISHTSASLTGDTTFVKSQGVFSAGTLPSLTISAKAPSKITAWSAGTTPVLSATPTYTSDKVSANSDAAITVLTGVKVSQSSSAAPGNHNHSVAISGATSAPGAHTDVVAAAYSNGVLTLSAVNVATGGHTHSYSASVTSGANSGDNFNAAIAVSADGTASVAPNGHTHNYDKTTGITLTRGDAPSLTYSEESVGSASGWSTGSLPSLGTATTGTVSISGGSISKTTKYLTHTHTAASAATTGSAVTSVASNGTVNAVTAIADAEN
jgi:hypothetical protein